MPYPPPPLVVSSSLVMRSPGAYWALATSRAWNEELFRSLGCQGWREDRRVEHCQDPGDRSRVTAIGRTVSYLPPTHPLLVGPLASLGRIEESGMFDLASSSYVFKARLRELPWLGSTVGASTLLPRAMPGNPGPRTSYEWELRTTANLRVPRVLHDAVRAFVRDGLLAAAQAARVALLADIFLP